MYPLRYNIKSQWLKQRRNFPLSSFWIGQIWWKFTKAESIFLFIISLLVIYNYLYFILFYTHPRNSIKFSKILTEKLNYFCLDFIYSKTTFNRLNRRWCRLWATRRAGRPEWPWPVPRPVWRRPGGAQSLGTTAATPVITPSASAPPVGEIEKYIECK